LLPKDLTGFTQISKDVVLSLKLASLKFGIKIYMKKAIDDSIVDFADLAEEVMGNVNEDDNGIS
jgi:MraZ protein